MVIYRIIRSAPGCFSLTWCQPPTASYASATLTLCLIFKCTLTFSTLAPFTFYICCSSCKKCSLHYSLYGLISSHPSGHNLNVTSSERPFLISISRYSSFRCTVLLFLDYFLYDIDHFLPTYYLFTPLSPPPTLHYSMINLMSTSFATFLQQPAECLTQNTNSIFVAWMSRLCP